MSPLISSSKVNKSYTFAVPFCSLFLVPEKSSRVRSITYCTRTLHVLYVLDLLDFLLFIGWAMLYYVRKSNIFAIFLDPSWTSQASLNPGTFSCTSEILYCGWVNFQCLFYCINYPDTVPINEEVVSIKCF